MLLRLNVYKNISLTSYYIRILWHSQSDDDDDDDDEDEDAVENDTNDNVVCKIYN